MENTRLESDARAACLCGSVSVAIRGPYRWFAHCHCSMCRKQYGSLFGTGLGVAERRLRWLSPRAGIAAYRASTAFERPFCARCGAKAPALAQDGRTWNVPAGLLVDDPQAKPRSHIFVESRATFASIAGRLPQHAGYPPGFDRPAVTLARAPVTGAALAGSCLCGAVAFTATHAPRRLVNCYCSLCRRSRGGAFASTLACPTPSFAWRHGADRVRSFSPASSRYRHDFCADCGSPVPIVAPGASLVMVPAGTVDTPLPPMPVAHIHVASKPSWYDIADTGPQFAASPRAEQLAALLD